MAVLQIKKHKVFLDSQAIQTLNITYQKEKENLLSRHTKSSMSLNATPQYASMKRVKAKWFPWF